MKKSNTILWMGLLLIVSFCSCSNENVTSSKLLQKTIETSEEGRQETTLFTYNGSEIINVDSPNKRTDFTYTDGLITKIVVLYKATKILETTDYSYISGKLVQVVAQGRFVINYKHIDDQTISYERFLWSTDEQQVKEYHGVLKVENGNLLEDKRTYDNTSAGMIKKNNRTFKYDQNINPMSGIRGFDKLLSFDDLMSNNNSLMNIVEDSISYSSDQVTSSAKLHTTVFKYDGSGYPIEKVCETVPLQSGKTGYLKTEYFY